MSPFNVKLFESLLRNEKLMAAACAEASELNDWAVTQAMHVRTRLRRIRAANRRAREIRREQEFYTRRGRFRIWYMDDVCKGLSPEGKIIVDEFVASELPNLNKALIYEWRAQEARIKIKEEGRLLHTMKNARGADIRTQIEHDIRDAKNYFSHAGDTGEIGRLERFVWELKKDPLKSEFISDQVDSDQLIQEEKER